MIDVRDLTKHYGDVRAVDGVSFTCPDGKITGLLGPNGAGKTTTLRMIAGLIRPMRGTAVVDGYDVTQEPSQVRKALGVQSDMTGVYPRLTAREHFRYYGRFYGIVGRDLEERVQGVIDLLGMGEFADRRAHGFSRGQRQKIVIGRALVHNPRTIIMDEPTNGLDVMAVRETRQTIRDLRDRGHCILFTTHYMDEAERLCDYVAIIVRGKMVAFGSPAELRARTGEDNLEDAFVALAGGREGLHTSEYAQTIEEGDHA
ncbi:MAG: ATP-binding cassette domain-containing protein [Firmicutes bacterium]|jgi:sodium transport system ATP-binding protein|nr:ATP-binding cassette domain-containing protein [Bacillota bacterium]